MARVMSGYHGSWSATGYVASSTIVRTRSGWRTAKACVKKLPYESPYMSTRSMSRWSRTATMSSTANAVPQTSLSAPSWRLHVRTLRE